MNRPRSPIKTELLRRLPGQSLVEQRQKLYEARVEEPALLVAMILGGAAYEALAGFMRLPRHPWWAIVIAVGALAYLSWIVFRLRPRMRALAQAIEGERAIGQFLEALRAYGYKVFHDIPGDNFNVDHVVIGPAGIFTVETKTWSIPERGRAALEFDGASIRLPGRRQDSTPIDQASAQASWLRRLLEESTGRELAVQPVVLFPGWYVRKTGRVSRNVRVLNPIVFPRYLRSGRRTLSDEMIAMASFHLSRYVQTCTRPASRPA